MKSKMDKALEILGRIFIASFIIALIFLSVYVRVSSCMDEEEKGFMYCLALVSMDEY